MKLGFVAEQDRLPDSPDTVVPEEPTIGSIVRSKGNLYLLVTGRTPGGRLREVTRLVAETIRREYYYDESAGIVVCLEKAIKAANKKLGHQRERLAGDETNGPIGVAAAVVRGNELYVVTVGPAEAYLIRQARLSTLPDPHRERGLPTTDIEPDVWRGEISVGDSVVLASPNLIGRLGPDELKDAMVTLHPQSAMEHLHHRFIAADGTGSDGAIAFEATEVSATTKQRKLVPVKPPEPLAGTPDRSPIPLADSVTAGAAVVQQSARQARTAAGGAAGRLLGGVQDRLPRRSGPSDRRVTTQSSRRETQRRAAVAALALIVFVAILGLGVWYVGGRSGSNAEPRLADRRAEGADVGEDGDRPGLRTGSRPRQGRSAPCDRPADDGLAAARRRGPGGDPGERDRSVAGQGTRRARPAVRDAVGRRDGPVLVRRRQAAGRPAGGLAGSRTARRTSSTRRPTRSTGST